MCAGGAIAPKSSYACRWRWPATAPSWRTTSRWPCSSRAARRSPKTRSTACASRSPPQVAARIGMSAVLSPNTYLVVGQGDSGRRVQSRHGRELCPRRPPAAQRPALAAAAHADRPPAQRARPRGGRCSNRCRAAVSRAAGGRIAGHRQAQLRRLHCPRAAAALGRPAAAAVGRRVRDARRRLQDRCSTSGPNRT